MGTNLWILLGDNELDCMPTPETALKIKKQFLRGNEVIGTPKDLFLFVEKGLYTKESGEKFPFKYKARAIIYENDVTESYFPDGSV